MRTEGTLRACPSQGAFFFSLSQVLSSRDGQPSRNGPCSVTRVNVDASLVERGFPTRVAAAHLSCGLHRTALPRSDAKGTDARPGVVPRGVRPLPASAPLQLPDGRSFRMVGEKW